jgi:hypothetical protein
MGNQGHAGDGTRKIREWIDAGAIGTVREVHYWTNRPIWPQALERPTEAHNVPPELNWDLWLGPAPFAWRGWWDFGTGALGDIACHAMDAAFWTLDLGYPERIEPESTTLYPETAPAASRVVYHFAAKGNRPAVRAVWRDGSFGPPAPSEIGPDEPWPTSGIGGQLWIGDDGKLVAGIYGEEPRLLDRARHAELVASPPPETYARSPGVHDEWIAACKGGAPSGSPFDGHAGGLTEMVLLGVLATRMNRVLELDAATGTVTNVPVPEEWVTPPYREGWTM